MWHIILSSMDAMKWVRKYTMYKLVYKRRNLFSSKISTTVEEVIAHYVTKGLFIYKGNIKHHCRNRHYFGTLDLAVILNLMPQGPSAVRSGRFVCGLDASCMFPYSTTG